MKRHLRIAMLAIAAMVACIGSTASAQQADNHKRQRISREEFAQKEAQHIASQLALDETKTKQFVATFMQYQKEVWALRGDKRVKKGDQQQSEAQIEQNIQSRFDQQQKVLNIRKKYYAQYSKFLTQAQIQRVYEIEKQTMNRLKNKGGKHHGKGRRQQQQQ